MKATLTTEQFAKVFGVTVEQVNRVQLTEMYNEASRTGRRVNGYTSEQLRRLINGRPMETGR